MLPFMIVVVIAVLIWGLVQRIVDFMHKAQWEEYERNKRD
jgi:hypothetical protein